MKYEPHNYQTFATDYIITHPVAAVFLDCGLGKTVITLTAIEELMFNSFEVTKVLVVAPLRVAKNTWSAEIEKWEHTTNLRYSVVVGTEAERKAALRRKADVYIINRENIQWLIEKSGYNFDFDMLVIDELSSFKSHQSKRFKALMKVRPTINRVIGLTGTPSSNGLMDLWAEFRLLDLGKRLGRFITHYREQFFKPDKSNGNIVYSYKPRDNAEDEIYSRISDITISMRAKDYLNMPECIYTTYPVYLSLLEEENYNTLRKELIVNLGDKEVDAANAAALTGKLLQMANGAVYAEGDCTSIHEHKLDALEDIIESMNGKPLMVAYWFKHDLQRIKHRFDVREIKTPADIKDWNAGKIPIAVIHPASAGHGLNLQNGGSTLVWFGLTWSLELYQQTNARLWRQGQKADTVVIHHIITKGTMDEKVMKNLSEKEKTQDALIDAVKAVLREDLK